MESVLRGILRVPWASVESRGSDRSPEGPDLGLGSGPGFPAPRVAVTQRHTRSSWQVPQLVQREPGCDLGRAAASGVL